MPGGQGRIALNFAHKRAPDRQRRRRSLPLVERPEMHGWQLRTYPYTHRQSGSIPKKPTISLILRSACLTGNAARDTELAPAKLAARTPIDDNLQQPRDCIRHISIQNALEAGRIRPPKPVKHLTISRLYPVEIVQF